MRLRNKKTGVIGELHYEPEKEIHFTVVTEDPADVEIHRTLAGLKEEWEDYEPAKPQIEDEEIISFMSLLERVDRKLSKLCGEKE